MVPAVEKTVSVVCLAGAIQMMLMLDGHKLISFAILCCLHLIKKILLIVVNRFNKLASIP